MEREALSIDVKSTGGIPNRTVDILENNYIIRKEERSGAQWYELTHARLIGPIKNANRARRDEYEKKLLKSRKALKITLPLIATLVVVVSSIFFLSIYISPSHLPIAPQLAKSLHILGYAPLASTFLEHA